MKNVPGGVTVLAVVLLAGCFDFGQPLPLSPPPDADSGGSSDASDSGGLDSGPPTDSGPPICTPMCPVDTTVVGPFDFPTQVEPIFLNNCSNGPCHNGGMGGSEYLTMGMVCSSTIGVVAAETMNSTMMPRITAGDAEQSYLFHKVRGTHTCLPPDGPDGGGARMPFGAPCLTPTELGTIRAWINDGASCL